MRRRKGMPSGKKRGSVSESIEAEASHAPAGEFPQTEAPRAEVPATPAQEPAPAHTSSAPATANAPSPEQARQIAEIEIAPGQIVSLLMRSTHHKQHSLADLEWLLLPAVLSGQFRIAHAQAQPNGPHSPVAAALWASVSSEVDQRRIFRTRCG